MPDQGDVGSVRLAVAGFRGALAPGLAPVAEAELARLLDPAAALETVHWGRNYLYRATLAAGGGTLDVVVKQFRNEGWRARWRKRRGASKARRSWRMARAFAAAGLATPEPLLLAESVRPEGPSFFVTRHLPGMVEARYLLRAANAGRDAPESPGLDVASLLTALGEALRRMHRAGFFHRDLSIGNVLLPAAKPRLAAADVCWVDLNRARRRRRLGLVARTRDLCRLAIFRPAHRRLFLAAYWGEAGVGPLRLGLFLLLHYGFRLKIASKRALRGAGRALTLRRRRAYPHLPPAPPGAAARDKVVWDPLSDQPHQHAARREKLAVRLADAGSHLRQLAAAARAAPAIARRYRQLARGLHRTPTPWDGVGVAVRPYPADPEAVPAALAALGVRYVLLRLHPWEEDHAAEEALARRLAAAGHELAFALPQNRELVRDRRRWRAKVEELAERFTPFGRSFQVGQAVNRSKWGVWTADEYLALAEDAQEILRRTPGVEILGPAVIDFELHATAALVNLRQSPVRFDALASLLYVDRRGAPERRQLGCDTVRKVVLLKAIADTARCCGPRSWITEVNWPLQEGPHAPAGRRVAVDEETQADYLARYYLLALGTGLVERVYWWQLVARGYGLLAPEGDGALRRRPAFDALATLAHELAGSRCCGPLPAPAGTFVYLFRHPEGGETAVAWALAGAPRLRLPRPARRLVRRGGESAEVNGAREVTVSPSPRYYQLIDPAE